MADLVIRKKDIENLGRKVMKEVYKFLHEKNILSIEEMKLQKYKLEKYLIDFYFNFIDENIYENCQKDKIKYQNCLKAIEKRIENENLDIDFIFNVLNKIKLEMELDEDLYFEKKGFINIYSVYDSDYTYLKD